MMPETAEEISEKPEVRKELQRATGEKARQRVKARGRDKFWFVAYALILAGCVVLFFLFGAKVVPLPQPTVDILRRILRGTALITVILAIAKAASVYALGGIEDPSTRFTLQRVMHLVVALLIALIVVSVIFVNWYAGIAARDVIDVGYLDTTLWEFGGQYISGDHPSGRLIKFPNEKVLDEIVWNYSWPLFPYIWNEIRFQIAYQSDLKFVADTMQQIVEKELGEEMMKRVEVFRQLLARTPVDELEVRSHPRVIFRVDEVTWIDAIVRYLVSPREAGSIKTRLIPKLLAALNAEPERVMFPKGDAR